MDASAKLLIIVTVAAFVTERALAAASYLLDTIRYFRVHRDAPVKMRAKAMRRFMLAALAGCIAFVVVQQANVRLLAVLKIENVHDYADFLVSWLAVAAGADRVRALLNGPTAGGVPKQPPSPLLHVRLNGGEVQELRRTA